MVVTTFGAAIAELVPAIPAKSRAGRAILLANFVKPREEALSVII
jgi:hypothetical protein